MNLVVGNRVTYKYNGKTYQEIMVSNNDIEMFKVCKYKIAVANADDEIKNIATELTLSNDEEGVKAILDKLYNELKS